MQNVSRDFLCYGFGSVALAVSNVGYCVGQ